MEMKHLGQTCNKNRTPYDLACGASLTRYDKIPSNLLSPLALETPPGVTAAARSAYAKMGPTKSATHNMALLSRYLHHRRWIWAVQPPSAPAVSLTAVSRILNTLTRLLCLFWRSLMPLLRDTKPTLLPGGIQIKSVRNE